MSFLVICWVVLVFFTAAHNRLGSMTGRAAPPLPKALNVFNALGSIAFGKPLHECRSADVLLDGTSCRFMMFWAVCVLMMQHYLKMHPRYPALGQRQLDLPATSGGSLHCSCQNREIYIP